MRRKKLLLAILGDIGELSYIMGKAGSERVKRKRRSGTGRKGSTGIVAQIVEARKRWKLSQTRAALAWGINVESIRAWEHGRNMPNGHNFVRLIQLGVIDPRPKISARK